MDKIMHAIEAYWNGLLTYGEFKQKLFIAIDDCTQEDLENLCKRLKASQS